MYVNVIFSLFFALFVGKVLNNANFWLKYFSWFSWSKLRGLSFPRFSKQKTSWFRLWCWKQNRAQSDHHQSAVDTQDLKKSHLMVVRNSVVWPKAADNNCFQGKDEAKTSHKSLCCPQLFAVIFWWLSLWLTLSDLSFSNEYENNRSQLQPWFLKSIKSTLLSRVA